jgi:hypothetical protein
MVRKKSTRKKTRSKARSKPRKTPSKPRITQTSSEVKIEKILIENFVSLQKVMTHLSVKFDNLTNQISKLLDLFEISAKSLAKKDFTLEKGTRDDKEIMQKLGDLSEQNKTIARGLTLMHERIPSESSYQEPVQELVEEPQYIRKPQALRKLPTKPRENKVQPVDKGGYQKSISSTQNLSEV